MAVTASIADSEDVCYEVLCAVADCHGVEPEAIEEPLSEVVNPDSLSNIWGPKVHEGGDVNGVVAFEYYGCRVTLTSDGRIEAKRL